MSKRYKKEKIVGDTGYNGPYRFSNSLYARKHQSQHSTEQSNFERNDNNIDETHLHEPPAYLHLPPSFIPQMNHPNFNSNNNDDCSSTNKHQSQGVVEKVVFRLVKYFEKPPNNGSHEYTNCDYLHSNSTLEERPLICDHDEINSHHAHSTVAGASTSPTTDDGGNSTTSTSINPNEVEDWMRRRLYYHFMTPVGKFHAKRRIPCKLFIQILKVLLVTIQLIEFGFYRAAHVSFGDVSHKAFCHLYLRQWDSQYETLDYPPATGDYAVYTIEDFYQHIGYTITQFNKTEELAIGGYMFDSVNRTMKLCMRHISPIALQNKHPPGMFPVSYRSELENCTSIEVKNIDLEQFNDVNSIKTFLQGHQLDINFNYLLGFDIEFNLFSPPIYQLDWTQSTKCYRFMIKISLENPSQSGQMKIILRAPYASSSCDDIPKQLHHHTDFDSLHHQQHRRHHQRHHQRQQQQHMPSSSMNYTNRSTTTDGTPPPPTTTPNATATPNTFTQQQQLTMLSNEKKNKLLIQFWDLLNSTTTTTATTTTTTILTMERKSFFSRSHLVILIDSATLSLGIISCILCIRSIIQGFHIWLETVRFFKHWFGIQLNGVFWEFIRPWILFIIVNDIVIITTSIYALSTLNHIQVKYEPLTYLMGIGALLVWIGILYYVGFSYDNSLLIRTISHSIPGLLRFCVCALILFFAFSLCGWVVLGPYNLKFRTFISTVECLYSLINGDDMFVTFSIINENAPIGIYLFSRLFLYIFITLFIYVVLNLFVTIIFEAYEEVKNMQTTHGRSLHTDSPLWHFICQQSYNPKSTIFKEDELRPDRHLLHKHAVGCRLATTTMTTTSSSTSSLLQHPIKHSSCKFSSIRKYLRHKTSLINNHHTECHSHQQKTSCCCHSSRRRCCCSQSQPQSQQQPQQQQNSTNHSIIIEQHSPVITIATTYSNNNVEHENNDFFEKQLQEHQEHHQQQEEELNESMDTHDK